MSSGFTGEEAEYVRKELGTALEPGPETVKVKAVAPGYTNDRNGSSHWVGVPRVIFEQMTSMVRGEGDTKPVPDDFMDGRVVMTARIPVRPGQAPHQALVIREYKEDGELLFSVHYLVAKRITDPWASDQGEYGIQTREEAFAEFSERMYQRGELSRKVIDRHG